MGDSALDLERLRHSTAHVMAAALCRLYGDVQLDIGPATDGGFYYDVDLPKRLTPEDFPAIEAEMAKIIAEKSPFERLEVSRDEAAEMLAGQTFKLERLSDIPEGEPITFYRCADFLDLCRGPHVENTGDIRGFKLTSVAGSYFRGHETNPMLQRIYGIAAQSPKQVKVLLKQLEEAQKRDHRKIGKEMDLFSIQEDVGPGLVHWHPRGARIRSIIEDFWRREHYRSGYELLYSPHIGRAELWATSGHLDFYKENMYAPMDVDGHDYFVKPMNCPFHIQVYKSHKRSYRDLPLRWAELGTVYRYEKSGVLHGLLRVRGFTQDDAHIFCTPEKIQDEVKTTVTFALNMLKAFGFDNVTAYLSTRPDKAVGEEARWDQATTSLKDALTSESIAYEVDAGGGAFYGPKIDLKIKDAIGREWQMGTIQFDFNLPEQFDLKYTGEDGCDHRPYMVHRALLGSIERFFGVLVEHYGGKFPMWLAPEQIKVLPITDDQLEYADQIAAQLREQDFRVAVDRRSERIGAKIRLARNERVPYMMILGGNEQESQTVALRGRDGEQTTMALDAAMAQLRRESEQQG
ncbi:MAG: threonine--tRNA ligase [Verrucomicrobia bacterium]|jgi:threonyl-tRNA synthetase|nr:threonine--tRNA ligase [Verrucomicrobiota bacterium]